jgi:sulfite reductase (NADPH) flavoprotein alpha-component
MHFQDTVSNGPGAMEIPKNPPKQLPKRFHNQSSSLPFGQSPAFTSIGGPTYVTAQTLVQQVAYALSDKLFTYSPEDFDLDVAVKDWSSKKEVNSHGYSTSVQPMQIRNGAGSIALGYMFSNDFDLKKRYIPQTFLASSSSLPFLRQSLEQLSLLYSVANPFVAHVAAADYVGGNTGGLVTDYSTALSLSEELGFGLVSSFSAYEAQHMSLLSTLLAGVLPTLHIYDGIKVGRETTRVVDVLDQTGLNNAYKSVQKQLTGSEGKHIDNEGKLIRLLKAFNDELGTEYGLFEYHGHTLPDAVLVSFGTVESSLTSQVASSLSKEGVKVGVINVRVYRPFVEEAFLKVLPKSVKTIGVLGQVHDSQAVRDSGVHSSLYSDILAALTFAGERTGLPTILDMKYARDYRWTPVNTAAAFQFVLKKPVLQAEQTQQAPAHLPLQILDPEETQQFTFWDADDSLAVDASIILGQVLSKDSTSNITTGVSHDNILQGGSIRTDIRKSHIALEAPYSLDATDAVYVGDDRLLKEVDVLANIKEGGKLLLRLPGVKDEDLEKKLPAAFKKALAKNCIDWFIVDPSASEVSAEENESESSIIQLAFLRIALPSLEGMGIQKLSTISGDLDTLEKLSKDLDNTLRQVEVPESWLTEESDKETVRLPRDLQVNSFSGFNKIETEPESYLKDWKVAAKGLLFKEAYETKPTLRPDLSTKTYTVHVKENRRLTPLTYDRNIFHIEFDLGTSGLKYDIGEALGIHAENNPTEVLDFIKFYNLNASDIVEVPSREDPSVLENRTVYQALLHNVDIFGRPPKRFYEALAEFATNEKERKELLALGGPEGATEFKRRAEVDTITFADILLEFPSAHPSFHDIVRIVSPMKRREYSIASCQAVTPASVALMVVVVNWVDPKGRDRFGQATHYLSQLPVGAPVTVSIKPSVMKLPPKATQPLIMAGLGTGLAPFRAFVQHRAMEKAQGKEIGSVLLYMGSRHQREEYCYGEEWEAYVDAGVITLLGQAFSRDQPHKIYIQDRMRQTMDDILKAYIKEDGAFYLCGPTWPVPDVTNVLEEAIRLDAKRAGAKKVDSRREIERLKDDGRYVLEVY